MRKENKFDTRTIHKLQQKEKIERKYTTEQKDSRDSRIVKKKSELLVESLQLPKDIMLGAIKVNMTGNREAWIENYKGILEYTEKQILLQGKHCKVCLEGRQLSIDYYTNEDMKISGYICCVRYMD